MVSDLDLVDAWRGGDSKAGAALLERHFDKLFRFFANKVGPAAEDLIQQTMLNLLKGVHQFEKRSTFRTYLFAIARNELYAHLRKRKKENDLFDPQDQSVCDMGTSPSRAVARKREHALLLEGLRRIPVDLQLVLELTYWEDLTSEEIAEVLDVPVGTAKSRVRRAREALGKAMRRLLVVEGQPEVEGELDFGQWARELRRDIDESSSA